MDQSLSTLFLSIPVITRSLLVLTVSFSFASAFLSTFSDTFYYWPTLITRKYHIWRIVTPFFLSALNFNFLMHLFMLYQFAVSLERTYFRNDTRDFVWYLIFLVAFANVVAPFVPATMSPTFLTMAFITTESKNDPTGVVSLLFGITVKKMYLPWAWLVINVILSGGFIQEFVYPILAAHTYYYLRHVLPSHYPSLPFLV